MCFVLSVFCSEALKNTQHGVQAALLRRDGVRWSTAASWISVMCFIAAAAVATYAIFAISDAELRVLDAEQRALLAEQKANDPDWGKKVAMRAFEAAEKWRESLVDKLYANMTPNDWNTASRWRSYAEPFSSTRSCNNHVYEPDVIAKITTLCMRLKSHSSDSWGARARQSILSLHAYHSTGLEGNTLTLPETALIIDGKSLFAGIPDHMASPRTGPSATEARNLGHVYNALKLAELPCVNPTCAVDVTNLTIQTLVDINAGITRDMGTPVSLRRHSVAIGHQKVLLPMPDELYALVSDYAEWLTKAMLDEVSRHEVSPDLTDIALQISRSLSIACDAHMRFVHIHPFADGNGRLARTVSGLVLQRLGLPAPLFSRDARAEYMAAVARAANDRYYYDICDMHARAVLRSLQSFSEFATVL